MKKLILLLFALVQVAMFGQDQTFNGTKTFTSPPKFLNLSPGSANDSIAVITPNGTLKRIKRSDLLSDLNFQEVTTNGNNTTNDVVFGPVDDPNNITINSGSVTATKDSIWTNSFGAKGISQQNTATLTTSGFDSEAISLFDGTTGFELGLRSYKLFLSKNGFQTSIEAPDDLDGNYIHYTPKANGTLALESYVDDAVGDVIVSPFETITEGGNTGIALTGRNPLKYGNIGIGAIDFSKSDTNSSTYGATGGFSYSTGYQTAAPGTASRSDGGYTNAGGNYSHAEGFETSSPGSHSHSSGIGNTSYSFAETSLGSFGTIYTPIGVTGFNAADRIYNIGNGISDASRSDAFTVFKNGTITAPSFSIAEIDAAGNPALITLEKLNQQLALKQNTLVSGTNIKTINGNSLLGSGDLAITGIGGSGTVNYIPKFSSTTTIGNSQIFDNGTNVGLGTITPTNSLSFGNSINRKIWIENTDNLTNGKDLTVSAGSTVAGSGGSGAFTSLAQTVRDYYGMTSEPDNDVYVCTYGGDIYKQTNATGNFIGLSQASRNWTGITSTPNGNIYAAAENGDIYKQTGGVGSFTALSQTSRKWAAMTSISNNDVYAIVQNGDVYKQTGGTGNFIALGQTVRNWTHIASAPNNDVYACVYGGDIYKQTGGTGNFIALSQTTRNWIAMTSAPNGDIYCAVDSGDIYKQTGGTGNFVALGGTSRSWIGMTSITTGEIYASVYNGNIYKYSAASTPNINGGKLIIQSGQANGSGTSVIEFQTSDTGSSGTTLQSYSTKLKLEGDGKATLPNTSIATVTASGAKGVPTVEFVQQASTTGSAGTITGNIAQSQVTGLTASLALKADDNLVVHLAGTENITGVKDFTNGLSAGGSKWVISSTGNPTKINNVVTSFPASQGAARTTLQNDGSGNLNWVQGANGQFSPANPTGNNTTTPKMQGIGSTCTITPSKTGNLLIIVAGNVTNGNSGGSAIYRLRYGTGTAPANGAAVTGTTLGPLKQTISTAGLVTPGQTDFTLNGVAIGLTIGTTYWIDYELYETGGGTAAAGNLSVSVIEQ